MASASAATGSSAAGTRTLRHRRTVSALRPDRKIAGVASKSTSKVATCYGFPTDSLYDTSGLPDYDTEFLPPEHIETFRQALAAPDPLQSPASLAANTTDDGGAGSGYQKSPTASTDHLHFTKRNSVASGASGTSDVEGTTYDSGTAGPAASLATPTTPFPPNSPSSSLFITAKNDWAPVYEKVAPPRGRIGVRKSLSSLLPALRPPWNRQKAAAPAPLTPLNTTTGLGPAALSSPSPTKRRRSTKLQRRGTGSSVATLTPAASANSRRARAKAGQGRRTRDETREGYLYGLLKWPFLLCVFAWIIGLSIAYLLTRMYIAAYEQLVTWRGQREKLRRRLRATSSYADWVAAARSMDTYLGNDRWKEENEFAFYDYRTVRRVYDQLRRSRTRAAAAEAAEADDDDQESSGDAHLQKDRKSVSDLKALVEACVKNNFAGVENRHLYSRTYYGTKNLVQNFVDEVERSLLFLIQTKQLDATEKRALFKRIHANYGRTALCLSGGASFAFYHFGVVKALLDQDLLPDVITGTSGGALVAALVATRTDAELRELLVPALAGRIRACFEPPWVWVPRWWKTGARFDSVLWAQQCSWWTHGSMTFREAYERTGRILNVTCVPADPHSPTILCNYKTAPDCVIWSAVLASAAVPGILNPVVLMMKTPSGQLVPYSFGHKWKDGSLRTDIPIRSLNLHFNVNFTVVSQVNPHVNLFFFSSRGSVGTPVTHRKGRGWRGGYLGSAFEEYLKQDLRKWLKLLRNLELLPRPMGQDWSQLWLQPFSGTITIWPKSIPSDFVYILSDPDPPRLARMIHEGQQSAFPPLKFVSNRLRVERLIERGRLEARMAATGGGGGGGNTNTNGSSRRRRTNSSGLGMGLGMGLGAGRSTNSNGHSSRTVASTAIGNGHRATSSNDSLPSDEEQRRALLESMGSDQGLHPDAGPYGRHGGSLESTTASTEEEFDDDDGEDEENGWSDSSDSEVLQLGIGDEDMDEEEEEEEPPRNLHW